MLLIYVGKGKSDRHQALFDSFSMQTQLIAHQKASTVLPLMYNIPSYVFQIVYGLKSLWQCYEMHGISALTSAG